MSPARLLHKLSLSSIRSRMLVIALLPALLTEFGIVAYFANETVGAAERDLHARASNAARHLASSLPYGLVSGDLALVQRILDTEARHSRLAFARVTDPAGRVLASSGDTLRVASVQAHHRQRLPVQLPTTDMQDDALFDASSAPTAGLLGNVEVGVTLDEINTFRRTTLLHAALLMLVALALTAALAWRLSNRLAGQLRHVGEVVGRLARDDLGVRTQLRNDGEVGQLAAGVNDMAEALEAHRHGLEARIAAATADLAAKKDLAERANQAKSRFFAAASHDLRQPLHALSLFVAALKARNQQPEAQTLIDNIENSTAAMELLFNALLDISRLDAGTIEAQRVHFPLQKTLNDLEQHFSPIAAEKQLTLKFRPCNATLYSDPLLVERILVNLIANAIRYTDDGGILVGCRDRGNAVRISVVDTGRGIAPEQQDAVFQEFVQLHNPARDRNKGLGLGLAIVARLGRLLNLPVHLSSRAGHGSVFSIDVPRGDPHLLRTALVTESVTAQLGSDTLVLLVDDENAILRGMTELFDHWNIGLVTAHSASEAEQWLDGLERAPDVIVTDYRLPDDVDGLDVIRRLRGRYARDIPAVVVTGDTAPDTIQRITQAGFPLLHKPLRPAKLRALLTHLVQQSRGPAVG